jgi:hypothetical protein
MDGGGLGGAHRAAAGWGGGVQQHVRAVAGNSRSGTPSAAAAAAPQGVVTG